MSVRQAQAEIDSQEFAEWMAYDRVQPFGPERADMGPAQLCALFANVNRKQGSRPFKVADFMPDFLRQYKHKPSKQTPGNMATIMNMFTNAHNKAQQARRPREAV
jgi:hypothetical protein